MTIVRPQGNLNVEHVSSVQPGTDLVLDLATVTWTYPSGLVALACLGRDAASLEVVWPDDVDQQRYLSRMHLDRALQEYHPDVAPLPTVRHREAELSELAFFADSHAVFQLADLVRSHADQTRISSDWAWVIEEGTWEICDNALTHSEWGGGFLAAQHYPEREEIEYAVGDAGIGIRRSLAGEYPSITDDVSAIVKAREYGATRFGQDQRGVGLSETVDQVAGLGGRVVVRSGSVMVTFDRDGYTSRFTNDPWQGTLVKVVLPLPR